MTASTSAEASDGAARPHSPPVAVLALGSGVVYELLALWDEYGELHGACMDREPHYMAPHRRLTRIINVDFCLNRYGGTLTPAAQWPVMPAPRPSTPQVSL